MFTGSLAMLHRALRLDARLVRTHLFRLGFVGLIYFALLYAQATSLTIGAPGLKLFDSMSFLNLGLITLAGISFFATAISEEKEEETLGLLKMAGINPLGLLLGKSTSRLVGTLLLLLVQFPFTLLAITLGGVTLTQVFAAYFSLSAYMVFLANLGLLCSVACRRGGTASALTVLALVFYFLAGPVLSGLSRGLVSAGIASFGGTIDSLLKTLSELGNHASIYTRLSDIMLTNFAGPVIGFQFLSNVAAAAFCFVLAWGGFNHFTRDWRLPNASEAIAERLPRAFMRSRRLRPKRDALAWKEFHFVTGGWPALWLKSALYGVITLGVFFGGQMYYGQSADEAGRLAAGALVLIMALEASIYASRVFHDEWRDHTLPLLMMLPIRTPRIVYSKFIGCLPALVPGLIWLGVAAFLWPRGLEEAGFLFILPSRWFAVLVVLLFLTLTAFFSLVVKWGSLPLAIAVMLLGATCGGACFSPIIGVLNNMTGPSDGMEGAFLCVDTVVALLIAGLQFDIHRRLEIVATQ